MEAAAGSYFPQFVAGDWNRIDDALGNDIWLIGELDAVLAVPSGIDPVPLSDAHVISLRFAATQHICAAHPTGPCPGICPCKPVWRRVKPA